MSTSSTGPEGEPLASYAAALEKHYRRKGMNVDLQQDKAVAKAALTSTIAATGAWLLTEEVFGFWGLVLAVPATWGVHLWLARRARRI